MRHMNTLMKTALSLVLCSAFTLNTSVAQTADDDAVSEKEGLVLTALEGLMMARAERALPLVQKVLNADHSDEIKSRALFVLSQINLPQAQEILVDYARDADSALQADAIRMIGVSGDAQAMGALADIYQSGDAEVRRQVLSAYLISGDKEAIYNAALNADSEEEFDDAIRMLGSMGATEQLRQLYEQGERGESLVQAYALTGDIDGLVNLIEDAEAEGNVELQAKAISQMGIIGGEHAKGRLVQLYSDAEQDHVRDAAIQGLMINGADDSLLMLYRNTDDIEQKRALLHALMATGGDAALEAIDAALEGGQP